jgi:hypothetical protein
MGGGKHAGEHGIDNCMGADVIDQNVRLIHGNAHAKTYKSGQDSGGSLWATHRAVRLVGYTCGARYLSRKWGDNWSPPDRLMMPKSVPLMTTTTTNVAGGGGGGGGGGRGGGGGGSGSSGAEESGKLKKSRKSSSGRSGELFDWSLDSARLRRMKEALELVKAYIEADPSRCSNEDNECEELFVGPGVC